MTKNTIKSARKTKVTNWSSRCIWQHHGLLIAAGHVTLHCLSVPDLIAPPAAVGHANHTPAKYHHISHKHYSMLSELILFHLYEIKMRSMIQLNVN